MELAFIISAVRRYFWFVIVMALAGALPGLLGSGGVSSYRSHAVLLVSPPADSAPTFSGDADRYVISQLSVLRSNVLAERVAGTIGGGTTISFVSSAATFDHEPETDIIGIDVVTSDPELSQAIGDAYLEAYVVLLADQAAGALEPIDAELMEVRQQIEDNDQRLEAAMAPYLLFQPAATGDAYPPIPSPDQVVPSVVSEREILISKYNELLSTRTRIETNNLSNSSGRIIQSATRPTAPVPESSTVLIGVGMFGGAFVGLLSAVLIARLSPRVLDDLQAEEILGRPIVGTLPWDSNLAGDRRLAIGTLGRGLARVVDSLCVRAGAIAESRGSLTVVVVGTQRKSGATTLACSLANRFAANGSTVLLVDGDQRHPEITTWFAPRLPPPGEVSSAAKVLRSLAATDVANLEFASFTDGSELGTLRPQQVSDVLAEASARAEVVVVDGGPVMSSSSTVQLTRLCDAVILTVPERQEVRPLVLVARELQSRSVLPIWTPMSRLHRWARLSRLRGSRRSGRERVAGSPDKATTDESPSAERRDPATRAPRPRPAGVSTTARPKRQPAGRHR